MIRALLLVLFVGGSGLSAATFPRLAPEAVVAVEIQLDARAVASLRKNPRENVPASVRFSGKALPSPRVRLKGQGSFAPIDQKPSLTITLPEPLFGATKLHLNNSAQDATFLRELVGAGFMAAAGLPVQRVGHAVVRLNGRELGLFILKEGFTEEFARRQFGAAGGSLFETERGDIDTKAERKFGASSLEALLTAAKQPDLAARWAALNAALDTRGFATLMAAEVMICHWDGYSLGVNNFRVYVASSGAAQFIPAGMDQLFALPNTPWKPEFSGLIARALMETPQGAAFYEERFRALFTAHFEAEKLVRELRQAAASIEKHLPRRERRAWRKEVDDLARQITDREKNLRAQLTER